MVKLNKQEQGRSMVEMLGVLAVIGVLSVAGIAGYSNAMKKHRANEILNEASKRAVMVAAQAMTGKTGEIALSEFDNNSVSGVTFSKAEIKENHIVLTLSGSGLADVCDQLKNTTGDNTVMKITKDDCSELTFNADMSKGTSDGNESVINIPQKPTCTENQWYNIKTNQCDAKAICTTNQWYNIATNVCDIKEICSENKPYYSPELNKCAEYCDTDVDENKNCTCSEGKIYSDYYGDILCCSENVINETSGFNVQGCCPDNTYFICVDWDFEDDEKKCVEYECCPDGETCLLRE